MSFEVFRGHINSKFVKAEGSDCIAGMLPRKKSGHFLKKSGHFLISCVSGENPGSVTGLGAAEAMATGERD
jgi:hypothetical protein